jgi:hypothetical protein
MYYEQQRGGLCRLHSLNAYFGCKKISDIKFNDYKKEYDEYYNKHYNIITSCDKYDIINSDQTTIVSFILKKHGAYAKFFALNTMHGKNINLITNVLMGDFIFMYNTGHIWGARRKSNTNEWFSLDSLSGIKPLNINTLTQIKNIGFIVPVNMRDELYRNLSILKKEINISPIEYLNKKYKENNLIGDIEVPLNIILDILQTNYNFMTDEDKLKFNPIQKNIKQYTNFLIEFSKKKSLDIILKYLPPILESLLKLSDQK